MQKSPFIKKTYNNNNLPIFNFNLLSTLYTPSQNITQNIVFGSMDNIITNTNYTNIKNNTDDINIKNNTDDINIKDNTDDINIKNNTNNTDDINIKDNTDDINIKDNTTYNIEIIKNNTNNTDDININIKDNINNTDNTTYNIEIIKNNTNNTDDININIKDNINNTDNTTYNIEIIKNNTNSLKNQISNINKSIDTYTLELQNINTEITKITKMTRQCNQFTDTFNNYYCDNNYLNNNNQINIKNGTNDMKQNLKYSMEQMQHKKKEITKLLEIVLKNKYEMNTIITDINLSIPTCSICVTDNIEYVLQSCGHTFCKKCILQLTKHLGCHICRKQVINIIHLYFS